MIMTRIKYRVYFRLCMGKTTIEEDSNLKSAQRDAIKFLLNGCESGCESGCVDIYDVDIYGCNVDAIMQYCIENGKVKKYTF